MDSCFLAQMVINTNRSNHPLPFDYTHMYTCSVCIVVEVVEAEIIGHTAY